MYLSEAEIERLIEEDLPYGDLTTRSLGIGDRPGRMTFSARTPLVACGGEEAARILERCGARLVSPALPGGRAAAPGDLLLAAEGPAAALFAGWKVAQTLMEWACGIATATAGLVAAARAARPGVAVACTRKAVPLTRRLSARAVLAGGGVLHRLGLSDTVLVFPEHLAFLDGAAAEALARLRAQAPERALVIEVTTAAAALEAAPLADVVQLEKFTPEAVAAVAAAIARRPDGRPVLAAAGGIGPVNAAAYAAAGADVLVTSFPYYAAPSEIQVRIHALPGTPVPASERPAS